MGRTQPTFTAYFDASGTRRSPILTVAGFVGRASKWERFNREWNAILAGESVGFMHMTDFVSSRGEFSSWKEESDRRREFLSKLISCIDRNTNKGFGGSLILADYAEINNRFFLTETSGQPFTFCMRMCLGGLARWASNKGIRHNDITVAIERGDDDQGELVSVARQDGFEVIRLQKADATAFQAADIAAWKTRTVLKNAETALLESAEDGERVLQSLEPVRKIIQNNGGYDRVALLTLCERGGISMRPTLT